MKNIMFTMLIILGACGGRIATPIPPYKDVPIETKKTEEQIDAEIAESYKENGLNIPFKNFSIQNVEVTYIENEYGWSQGMTFIEGTMKVYRYSDFGDPGEKEMEIQMGEHSIVIPKGTTTHTHENAFNYNGSAGKTYFLFSYYNNVNEFWFYIWDDKNHKDIGEKDFYLRIGNQHGTTIIPEIKYEENYE